MLILTPAVPVTKALPPWYVLYWCYRLYRYTLKLIRPIIMYKWICCHSILTYIYLTMQWSPINNRIAQSISNYENCSQPCSISDVDMDKSTMMYSIEEKAPGPYSGKEGPHKKARTGSPKTIGRPCLWLGVSSRETIENSFYIETLIWQ